MVKYIKFKSGPNRDDCETVLFFGVRVYKIFFLIENNSFFDERYQFCNWVSNTTFMHMEGVPSVTKTSSL